MNKQQKCFRYLVIFLFISFMVSCVSSEKIIYFQDEEGKQISETYYNYQPKIQAGDILAINVSATEPEAAIPFNIYESQANLNMVPLPYIVNAEGKIVFPVLGKIKVTGMTTIQLTNHLTELLKPYLKEPTVNIQIDNFKVSVLGEVNRPGSIPVPNERITIPEAISNAGDLTIYGNRESVTLIREKNGKRSFIPIDLTDKDLFNSDYYYLTQNDVLYVEPNKTRINSSMVGPNTSVIISAFSILITLVAILVR